MRQLRELLRLHLLGGRSYAECGRALGVAKSTAGEIAALARAVGLDWSAIEKLGDEELEARVRFTDIVSTCRRVIHGGARASLATNANARRGG